MDYDKFGHCVLCGKCMIIEQVIDEKVKVRFTAEYDETEMLLDDGSRMRVVTCRNCKYDLSEKDYKKIMDKVILGWEEELKTSEWKEEKKKLYRDKYYKMNIVTVSENKPDDTLIKEIEQYKEKVKDGVEQGNKGYL